MRLPLPLPLILAIALPLIFGTLTLPLLFGAFIWPHHRPETVDGVWTPPAHLSKWQGYELAGVSRPGRGAGWGAIAPPEEFLVMRCRSNPKRRLFHEYWPGAGGFGGDEKVVWTADAATYLPGGFGRIKVSAKPHAFTLAEVEKELQC